MKLTTLLEHFRERGRLVLGVTALGLVARLATPSPPEKTVGGIAAMLGKEVGGTVAPDQFLWEPRGGALSDAILGRRVLFIADVKGPDGTVAGDLFRARVRLSRGGRAISVTSVVNLTNTPLGDDRDLVGRGRFVAFSTSAFGAVQGVTVLDLAGDTADREAKTRRERAQAAIESFLDTGSWQGLGRAEIAFGSPPPVVKLEMAEGSLVMAIGEQALPAALDPATGELNVGGSNPFQARAQRIPHPVRPFGPFAIDAVRRSLGGKPASAASAVLAALGGRSTPKEPKSGDGGRSGAASSAPIADEPATATPSAGGEGWPPARIAPPISPAMPGEGVWTASTSPLLPKASALADTNTPTPPSTTPSATADANTPAPPATTASATADTNTPAPPSTTASAQPEAPAPAFYEASIRPDPAHPDAVVRLVAMDMRQLELRIEAGFDEPRPTAGPRGSGKLPGAPQAERIVAAFAGGRPPGFEIGSPSAAPQPSPSAQGAQTTAASSAAELGMIVDRRILVPPAPLAFSIATERDGRAALGRWPFGSDVPDWIISLRQSPAPLVEAGAALLPQAAGSGAPSDRASEIVERSALCLTRGGHLIYAWSSAISANGIAKALALADCESGAHLAGSPSRSGFAYARWRAHPEDQRAWDVEMLTPAMSLPPSSLTDRSPAEIFYMIMRNPRPTAILSGGADGWTPDGAKQPSPAWIPAVFTGSASALGAEVKVTAFAPDRFVWRVRAGSREPSKKHVTFPTTLDADEQARADAAIALGVGRRRGGVPRGLSIGGASAYGIRAGAGALIVAEKGLALIRSDDLPADLAADVVELPLTADQGKVLPEGRKVGSRHARSAACVLSDGTLLIGSSVFDSEEAVTDVLLSAGCARVVALDRGSHQAAFLHRAGSATPPLPKYEQSVLYAIEIPMRGRTQAFAAPSSVPSVPSAPSAPSP